MHITNLGCIGNDGLTVALDDIVCLVGANNTGKTTVLRAYEVSVNQMELKTEDFNCQANGQPATVELWVHIPAGAGNVDDKWKEEKDGLFLVRSKWEWPILGGKPIRTTWDPSAGSYAEDGKASGLDTVFNSRLPKPFRIGSLEDPEEEHRKLLKLVLEPVANKLKALMIDEQSELRKRVVALQSEAEKPVADFRKEIERVESRVNSSYRRVFSAAEIKLTVSLGKLDFDPEKSLVSASRIDVLEAHGQTRWNQHGTGSQRALFWSMLEVRSELNRIAEERKQLEKTTKDKDKELAGLVKKLAGLKLDSAKQKCQEDIERIKRELAGFRSNGNAQAPNGPEPFLPGYMLLIDEPETALHPAAVRAAKEHLYSLAEDAGWQVMLGTHSPAFVDPLKDHTTIVRLHRPEAHLPPNVYRSDGIVFSEEEKENLKSLLAFDVSVAEMFFGSRVVIVEGDTEFAAFTEVMNCDVGAFPLYNQPLILRARGKATIPTLIKMLTHFKIDFSVLHDIDPPKTTGGARRNGAFTVNTTIVEAVAAARRDGRKVVHRCSCPNFEQQHGMELPDKDKPFESWKTIRDDASARASVRSVLDGLLTAPSGDAAGDPDDGQHFKPKLRNWVSANAADNPAYALDAGN